ncbi:MAG: MBL fold metallo-hydrolase [Flavobacteriales bacterium]|nr:MBL fold metallo-hydrolase [Flavobacteriales bacterium]MBK9535803.1 MBL fold metallo-hydrolase [Flavobacteriales bacterium]MBP9138718.1 MBL fold metallo-hydrolase [Flavobacteriales bacterium]HQV52810.1 MBL fold metallo-hydrolase [Flavobacteriales bacterium]HQX29819.1 MBL fold metallo-hydrolase [Flavobacteriales bacterium]
MKIEQIYTGCLAQGAYYIESNGEVAIIDPLRESQPYIDRAEKNGAKIKYVLETHFHADFVSGHVDLAKRTGATIIYGPNANPDFTAHIATDGEELKLGNVTIKVLHTPGHTMESTTYLLINEQGKPHCIFSGDTLFIGDVGRPDLAQKMGSLTQEDLAGYLYDSLHTKIMTLPDDVIVYPAHGAGSACGKNMSKETYDTLGNQKKVNYALKAATKEQFIKEVTDGILPPPAYFPQNVAMNKGTIPSLDKVKEMGMRALTPDQLELVVEGEGALVLDTREPQTFKDGFVPRSINIGLKGDFAPWVGAMIPDVKHPIVIVADEGSEDETVTRLARVGYDNVFGYLEGGINAWKKAGREADTLESISAQEFARRMKAEDLNVFDVRKQSEWEAEHLEHAKHASLQFLNDHLAEFNKTAPNYIHCAGGYRSMIASSVLKSRGYHNVIDVAGGFAEIKKTDLATTAFVCPSTLKS